MQTIDIINPLKKLEANAVNKCSEGLLRDGYLMAIRHAIELCEVQQQRIDLGLAAQFGEEVA
jgi:hypothetical protein